MGNGCCKQEAENNPDGSPKDAQTKEQAKDDPADLRRWAKDGDAVELERLLKRMPVKAIRSGAKKSEGVAEEEDHTALHFAAIRGSLPCAELLVLYGAGVNARGAGGVTPLHCALEGGRRDVAAFLLEHGADINAGDKDRTSPFLAVMLTGRRRLTTWLLAKTEAALNASATDRSGAGPCTVAARHGWWDLLERLAGMATDPAQALNTRSSTGETPLGWVLKYGASGLLVGQELERLVNLLLGKGASPLVPAFQEQIPPICLAAATGSAVLVAALRERGAVLDPLAGADSVRRNPLHYAAAKGHKDMASLLVREAAPAQLNLGDAGGNTPLHLAAIRGHGEVAMMLVESSEDVKATLMATNNDGISVFHLMLQAGPEEKAQQGVLSILERLGEEGSRAAIKDKEKVLETPLLLAVGSHQDQVVAQLLALGHNPDEANTAGETPLSRCLVSATVDTAAADGAIFKMLVDKGAKPESASGSSHPLVAVCKNPLSRFSEQVVELLVAQAGGDPAALRWDQHSDAGGRSPLHLAALYDNAFMVKYLLEKAKLDVESRCGSGLTPLMYAAMGCATNAIRVLLNRRADPRVADPEGRTALTYCLKLDRPESLACAAMLLVMGCPPNDSVDLRGEGLLHRAVRYGTSEFIRLWARYGGNLCLLATTEDTANDLPEELPQLALPLPVSTAVEAPGETAAAAAATAAAAAAAAAGAEARRKRAEGDYMDAPPQPLEVEEEEEETEGAPEDVGSGKMDIGSGKMSMGSGKMAGPEADAVTAGPDAGAAEEEEEEEAAFGFQGMPPPAGGSRGSSRASSTANRVVVGSRGSNQAGDLGGLIMQQSSKQLVTKVSGGGGGTGNGDGGYGTGGGGETASDGGLARYGTGGGGGGGGGDDDDIIAGMEEPSLESFSVPTGVAYGGYGTSGAVAEAVETEVARFPSFCRRPSVVEVRRWARRGAAWFDDVLPAAAEPDLLPLPPGDDEEEAEEEALTAEAAPTTHPALDADAIWRRMMLDRIKDRRPRAAPAGGVAESTEPPADAAADADVRAQDRHHHGSASGSFRTRGKGGGVAATGGDDHRGAAHTTAAVTSAGGGGMEDWMDEIVRAAEETMKDLQRGLPQLPAAVEGSDAAYGSGSRAVRAVTARGRRSATAVDADAAAPSSDVSSASRSASPPGASRAVAEATEGGGGDDSSDGGSGSDDSDSDEEGGDGGGTEKRMSTVEGKLDSTLDDVKDAGMGLASKLLDKQIAINDPYFKKGKRRYKGVPRYMDEAVVHVSPAPVDELLALADQLSDRLRRYPAPADEPPLSGANLRERNINWYNQSLSPAEYPLKSGQWKAALKKAKAAAQAARKRQMRKPGDKVVVRSRKAWFGLPAMPSRPELKKTSALVYAVRLARPACMAALLAASAQPLNLPDGWGHPPVAYAAYLLAREKHNTMLQQMYDMLLEKLPQVNFTRLDPKDGNAGHTPLCPINLAVITGDRSRLTYLVLRCAGAINDSWTALPDIPAYLRGTWEKLAAKCDSRCPPLVLAVMSKRIDTVKLVLDLGANPNVFGESRDVALKAKLAKEFAAEQAYNQQLQRDYVGVLAKVKLGLMQKLSRLKRAISNIELPGITKPHPFITPLHMAARTGQAEVAFLLLRRGALANGGGSVPYAKKTPLQEALMYARSNFTATNPAAKRKNWKEVRPSLEDVPNMSAAAQKKQANANAKAFMRAMVDPTMMALKAVALAAKYAVNFLLEMRKRPIAHWDPALGAAHVLLSFRAPIDLADTQTAIVLRDLMDNGKWKWLRRPAGHKFKVADPAWTEAAREGITALKGDRDIGYPAMKSTEEPKVYKSLKQQFLSRSDQAYFGAGSSALIARYRTCSQQLVQRQKQYVFEVLQPAITGLAEQAVRAQVAGCGARLELLAAARAEALEACAAALELGVALDERGVMDSVPYKRFALPATALPTDLAAEVAAEAQAAGAERLRALAGRSATDESWGRVAVWAPGGEFKGVPTDANLEPLPTTEGELQSLGKTLAKVDTDKLQESMENLSEQLEAATDWLLAKMQDGAEGLGNLLEIIGIDFLDIL